MPRCSVCQTQYSASNSETCPTCGWDLQQYSLMIGILPEVSAKEKSRLNWAQSIWSRIQLYSSQGIQLKQQLEAIAKTASALQLQLEQARQEQQRLEHLLQERQTAESQLQQQLHQAKEELHQAKEELIDLQERFDRHVLDSPPIPIHPIAPVPQPTPEPVLPVAAAPTVSSPPVSASAVTPALPTYAVTVQSVMLNPKGELLQSVQQTVQCHREMIAGAEFELMAIAGGNFWMGSPDAELGRDTHESPRRQVKMAPFLMGRFLVTQAQWRVIAHFDSIDRPLDPNPSHFKGDNLPVERVSWHDAVEFCARLSRVTGRSYRLPSEAEWEYACRAGTETPFHLGATLNSEFVNYDGNDVYGEGFQGQYRQSTTPVGTLATNDFGISDMHGNVWEWCEDPWHDDYQDAPLDGSVWRQGGNENHHVLRGGAWYCLPELCRSAQRHWDEVNHSGSGIGFRIACSML